MRLVRETTDLMVLLQLLEIAEEFNKKFLHECGRSDAIEGGHHSLRGILVVAQLAGSLTLLIVAGLFVRSLNRAENMFLGFDPNHVLTVLIDPHQMGYDQTRTKTF